MFKPKDKKRKRRLRKLISVVLIVTLVFMWTIVFPPKVNEVRAGEVTYSSGSGDWTAPITGNATVECWGGGGGAGGGGGTNKYGGGGGAGGQYAVKVVSVTQDTLYGWSIGAGGTTLAKTDGTAGGDTTFDTNVVVAKGGDPGLQYDNGGAGGVGSTDGGIGDSVNAGGSGAGGTTTYGGGGGGGAGSTGTGNDGSTSTGGAATSEYGGAGGDGAIANSAPGIAGSIYAAGGGGATKNGIPGVGAGGFIRITWTDPVTLTQNNFLIYVDNNVLDPTDIWGNPDIGGGAENSALNALPYSNDPVDPGDIVRIRMNITVTVSTLAADTEDFILQYKETNDCTDATAWTDVDAAAGGGTWRFTSGTDIADNTALGSDPPGGGEVNLAESDVVGRYNRSDPTTTNPYEVLLTPEDFEWDWDIEYNGNAEAHTYCFRMAINDGGAAALDGYNSDSYPMIDTRPGVGDQMRHGNFFTTGSERGFFWAD